MVESWPITDAVWASLAAVGRADSWLAELALLLSRRLDSWRGSSGLSVLVRELRSVMAEALEDVPLTNGDVDEVRAARSRRLAAGGA